MDDDADGEYVYEDDVEEEIILDDTEEDTLAAEIQDTTLEEYDADEEDGVDITVEEDKNCITTFREHDGPVFVVDIGGKNGEIAVSGGEDEVAYVWNINTGEILFTCGGHKDSVTCACFNADSTMVATGDMSGIIQAWNIESKKRVWEVETGDLEWLQWHPVASVLLAGTHDGQCWMWQIPKNNCKMFPSHGTSTSCGRFMPDGKSAAVGYEDGTLKVVDLKSAIVSLDVKGRDAHAEGISEIAASTDGTLLATASVDGTVKLVSAVSGKVSATYNCNVQQAANKENSDPGDEKESVECLAFSPTLPLLATGCLNGFLHVWDYKSGTLRHSCKHGQGVAKLLWEPVQCGGNLVYTGCLDGTCRVWDARKGQMMQTFTGARDYIYDIKLTKNGDRLVSASADGNVRVYDIEKNGAESRR